MRLEKLLSCNPSSEQMILKEIQPRQNLCLSMIVLLCTGCGKEEKNTRVPQMLECGSSGTRAPFVKSRWLL